MDGIGATGAWGCAAPAPLRVEMGECGVTFAMEGADELVNGSFDGRMELGMGFSTMFVVFGLRVCDGAWAFSPYHVALDGGRAPDPTWSGCVPVRVVARGYDGSERSVYRGILPKGFSVSLLGALERQATQEGVDCSKLAEMGGALLGLDERSVPMRAVCRMACRIGGIPGSASPAARFEPVQRDGVRIVQPRSHPVCS